MPLAMPFAMQFAATARSRRRGHWCSSPQPVVTTYAAINTPCLVQDEVIRTRRALRTAAHAAFLSALLEA